MSTTTPKVEPSVEQERERLLRTQRILQDAHDYIEVNGFDILTYNPEFSLRRACCYIGAVRLATGLDPNPDEDGADMGDGPELTYAFKVLDRIARREMSARHCQEAREEYPKGLGRGGLLRH